MAENDKDVKIKPNLNDDNFRVYQRVREQPQKPLQQKPPQDQPKEQDKRK